MQKCTFVRVSIPLTMYLYNFLFLSVIASGAFCSRFKDGLEIQDSHRIQSESIPKRGVAQLTILGATVRDIGLYTLEAHNLAGRAKSMVRISVRGSSSCTLIVHVTCMINTYLK